jgi:hypothetical protein
VIFALALSAVVLAFYTDRAILDGASLKRDRIEAPYAPYRILH